MVFNQVTMSCVVGNGASVLYKAWLRADCQAFLFTRLVRHAEIFQLVHDQMFFTLLEPQQVSVGQCPRLMGMQTDLCLVQWRWSFSTQDRHDHMMGMILWGIIEVAWLLSTYRSYNCNHMTIRHYCETGIITWHNCETGIIAHMMYNQTARHICTTSMVTQSILREGIIKQQAQ